MWFGVLKWLAGLVTGPLFSKVLDGYKAKLAAGTEHDKLAGDLASRELEVQQTEVLATAQLKRAEIGHPWEPEKLAMYITLVFYAKVVLWDVVLGNVTHGNTDPLRGQVGIWAELIMSFYFTKRGFENVSRILTRRWAG